MIKKKPKQRWALKYLLLAVTSILSLDFLKAVHHFLSYILAWNLVWKAQAISITSIARNQQSTLISAVHYFNKLKVIRYFLAIKWKLDSHYIHRVA